MDKISMIRNRITWKIFTPLALAAGLFTTGPGRADDASQLAGTWAATAMVMGGVQAPDKAVPTDLNWVFTGDKLTWQSGTTTIKVYTCELNSAASPKQMDLIDEDSGGTMKAIYILEGGVLTLCADNHADQDRPANFVSPKGSQIVLWVLKKKG